MMGTRKLTKFAVSGLGLLMILTAGALVGELFPASNIQIVSSAEARIGRPLTPVSYAGVARRTTRRAVVYGGAAVATTAAAESMAITQPVPMPASVVAAPPPNCPAEGAVFVCGGYAYKPVMQGSTVVYLVQPGY